MTEGRWTPRIDRVLAEFERTDSKERTLLMNALSIASRRAAVGAGVTKTPGVCGGSACIAGTRIPVYQLVEMREQGAADATLLEAYPHLDSTDLAAAWDYAEAHRDEMATEIRENNEA